MLMDDENLSAQACLEMDKSCSAIEIAWSITELEMMVPAEILCLKTTLKGD